jgi:hypothetical protein
MTSDDASMPMPFMSHPFNTPKNTTRDHPCYDTTHMITPSGYDGCKSAVHYYSSHKPYYKNKYYASHYENPRSSHDPEHYEYPRGWPPHHLEQCYAADRAGFPPPVYLRNSTARYGLFFATPSPREQEPTNSSACWLPEAFVPPRHHFSAGTSFSHHSPAKATPRPNTSTSDETDDIIWKLRDNDVVCGRGAPSNFQRGNQVFRDVIVDYQTVYLCAKRGCKPKIATEVLEHIQSRGGRFVRRVKTSHRGGRFGWEEIGEKRAYEKVCQALREGAPELRRKMLASDIFKEANTDKDNCTPCLPYL